MNSILNEFSARMQIGIPAQQVYREEIPVLEKNAAYSVIAKFGHKKKEATTVIQHYLAINYANLVTQRHQYSKGHNILHEGAMRMLESESKEIQESGKEFIGKFPFLIRKTRKASLITERNIKKVHSVMAENLIDEGQSPAGTYRTHPIMTDFDSHYTAPSDIERAMQNFIRQYKHYEKRWINPIFLAAWASTQFVLIHPFSDFNGRISRIIMNMIFHSYGLPFWISLKSTKKERKRYYYALKNYRRNKQLQITTLISMQLIQTFEQLNNSLKLADYPLISKQDAENYAGDLEFLNKFSDEQLARIPWPEYLTESQLLLYTDKFTSVD